MKSSKTVVKSSGISFSAILGLIFVTLKLMGFINWSWWWVTLPFWAAPVFFFGVAALTFIIGGTALLVAKIMGK